MPEEKILLPKKLTAENGAKYALIGEFFEEYNYLDDDGEVATGKVAVRWDTIKAIWDRAVKHFEALDREMNGSKVRPSEVPHERDAKA